MKVCRSRQIPVTAKKRKKEKRKEKKRQTLLEI